MDSRHNAAMFAEEKPALLPLPLEPFRYYKHRKRSVNIESPEVSRFGSLSHATT